MNMIIITYKNIMFSFDAIVLKEADLFLMMDRPEKFNRALEKASKYSLGDNNCRN